MKLPIMQSFPASRHFLPLRSRHSPVYVLWEVQLQMAKNLPEQSWKTDLKSRAE